MYKGYNQGILYIPLKGLWFFQYSLETRSHMTNLTRSPNSLSFTSLPMPPPTLRTGFCQHCYGRNFLTIHFIKLNLELALWWKFFLWSWPYFNIPKIYMSLVVPFPKAGFKTAKNSPLHSFTLGNAHNRIEKLWKFWFFH